MPFKSENQRRFMWSQHPEIAKRWTKEGKGNVVTKKSEKQRSRQEALERRSNLPSLPSKPGQVPKSNLREMGPVGKVAHRGQTLNQLQNQASKFSASKKNKQQIHDQLGNMKQAAARRLRAKSGK